MRKVANIYWLGINELRSFLHDFVLLGLVAYAFSFAVTLQARSNSQELHNASIAIVDEDHLVLDPERRQHGRQLGMQQTDIVFFVPERDHDGDVGRHTAGLRLA